MMSKFGYIKNVIKKLMKSTSSYFILLVSFFGLLFLQQYENRNNQRAFPEQNQKTKIDQTIMRIDWEHVKLQLILF